MGASHRYRALLGYLTKKQPSVLRKLPSKPQIEELWLLHRSPAICILSIRRLLRLPTSALFSVNSIVGAFASLREYSSHHE